VQGLNKDLDQYEGISKVSVQTGTSHGGVVNEDGSLAPMQVDFNVLKNITRSAKKYQIGGSVQHGASTLSPDKFQLFPQNSTLEIHLATGWQNIIFDSPHFPSSLKSKIYRAILSAKSDPSLSDAQYLYKERKRAWGKYKQEIWDLDEEIKSKLRQEIQNVATQIFHALGIEDSLAIISKYAENRRLKATIHDYQGD